MGRYSDSDDDRKKRKKKKKRRSRSRSLDSSDSRHSYKQKKSKKHKKQRSRSRSPDIYRKRSRSRSFDNYRRSRSKSPKYARRRSRSRDRSTSRYSRSRSRSPGYSRVSSRRRSRSTSRDYRARSRDRYRRSRSRSMERYKSKSKRRSRSLDRVKSSSKYSSASNSPSRKLLEDDPTSKIPGFSDMTPSEQAKIRMQLALRAAAAADEKIKEQIHGNKPPTSNAIEDQLKFSNAVQEIESSSFEASSFKSMRSDKSIIDDKKMDFFNFGTAAEFKPDMLPKKKLVIDETSNLAHSNLFVDPEEKMERWIQRLAALRKKKLEGEAI